LAAVTFLAGCNATGTHLSEGSSPLVSAPAPTTIVPAPSTTLPAPATTVPATAASVRSATIRVCNATTDPNIGITTELATPNAANLAYSATPGGPAVGTVSNPWGGPSSRPVANEDNGWVQIALYTRPNGSMGWVPAQDVTLSSTTDRIVVSICERRLTLYQGSDLVYSAPVGVGQPQWPTPQGATFVDAVVTTPRREVGIYGPTVIMLGTHSNVFTDFDGGDGVVAIHGYPSDEASTEGVASSHGCVRASPTTINTVKVVPVGTPVDVIP
jgi:L,D-transpeptidase catalytic domain